MIAAEYSYAPYGAVTATGAAAKANPFRYLGAYQLQRGHYLLGYRVYDSAFARFRSTDPTGQEANPYNYAQGDPINRSDPAGAYGESDFLQDWSTVASFAGVGGALGAGAGVLGCVFGPVGCAAGAGVGTAIGGSLFVVVGVSYVLTSNFIN